MGRWTFGDFVLDLDARQLARAGIPISLSPKAFQLLGILVDSQARALSKTELQERLWPGTFVVEKNLTNLIGEIRAAIDEDPAHPRFIRTLPRFGYAFREAFAADRRDTTPHNLPASLTNFIGREREIAELVPLASATRLLTLSGAGGCGKTRLALQVAAGVLDRFADGVWFVDLSPLSDPALVLQTVGTTLGVREGPGRPLRDALLDHVRHRQMLLVLDNCEHLIAAAAQLVELLLQAAARLVVLATSREALALTGETVWRVPSLSLPDPLDVPAPDALLQHDAVRLFAERARASDRAFTVRADNGATVAELCRRLDGIPLALELAAARIAVLSVEQIHARLNDRFRLLTGGSRTAVARHRTLEATVDWSYDLLSDAERQLLRRLSVFAGGWTLDAAQEVAADDEHDDVLNDLSRLVDKSLVIVDSDEGDRRRYRFLETIRQYARERLRESGEAERIHERQFRFFQTLAQRAEPELSTFQQVSWLNRLNRDHDNLRLALDWCLAAPERGRQGLELATALRWFWIKRGYLREGHEWLERVLSATVDAPSALRARATVGLGTLAFFLGDIARAQVLLDESTRLGQDVGDLSVVSFSLGMSAMAAMETGDFAGAVRLADAARAAARRSPDLLMQTGPALACLAYVAMQEGDLDHAAELHEETLEGSRRLGDRWGVAMTVGDVALLRVVQGRLDEARALCIEGIELSREFGDRRGVAWCLGILSGAEAADGRAVRAARLRGAMEGLLESIGAPVQATYRFWIGDRYLGPMTAALGDAALAAALAEGRAMSLTRAIEVATASDS